MKVYDVDADDGERSITFATKGAAMKEARRAAREYCPFKSKVTVTELTVAKVDKALLVRLMNHAGGYVEDSRIIATLPSKRTRDETRDPDYQDRTA